jgi:hypothetical protein
VEWTNHIKTWFNDEDTMQRSLALQYDLKHKVFALFNVPVAEYWLHICGEFQESGEDLTASLEWIDTMTILMQKRNLGLPPKNYTDQKVKEYLLKLTEEVQESPECNDTKVVIGSALERANIPPGILMNPEGRLQEMISEAMRVDIRQTATVNFTRADGGKVREAQVLFMAFFKNGLNIPVRNMTTGEITTYIESKSESPEDPGIQSEVVFWLSLQILLNMLVLEKEIPAQYIDWNIHKATMNDGGLALLASYVFTAKAEFIKEPGKIRGLTKTTGILYWALSPAMAMLNSVIALLPEHYDGLKRGAHAWRFQRRISGVGGDASYFYSPSGEMDPDSMFYYNDWTEATDFIPKAFGVRLLRALMDYTRFPYWYQNIVMVTMRRNLEIVFETEEYQGSLVLKRGYMMGLPLTKTVLHLCHVYKQELIFLELIKKGYKIAVPKGKNIPSVPYRFPSAELQESDQT